MSFIEPLNKIEFDELTSTTSTFAFLDFYADWCGPCMRMLPTIENLAQDEEFVGKINFYKVNVDYESELAESFSVRGIPAFHLIETQSDGKFQLIKSWVGSQDPFKLKADLLLTLSIPDEKKEVIEKSEPEKSEPKN
jgi:thiol-disulfide isomerase/thioredoxin